MTFVSALDLGIRKEMREKQVCFCQSKSGDWGTKARENHRSLLSKPGPVVLVWYGAGLF